MMALKIIASGSPYFFVAARISQSKSSTCAGVVSPVCRGSGLHGPAPAVPALAPLPPAAAPPAPATLPATPPDPAGAPPLPLPAPPVLAVEPPAPPDPAEAPPSPAVASPRSGLATSLLLQPRASAAANAIDARTKGALTGSNPFDFGRRAAGGLTLNPRVIAKGALLITSVILEDTPRRRG